jgi:hypothetical protein
MHNHIFTNLNQWLHNKTHIFDTNNLGWPYNYSIVLY